MAKQVTTTKTKEEPKQELVTKAPPAGGVPAHLAGKLAESQGRGVSQSRDDNIVPLIYVLQTNSPQVDERGEGYVEGAKPGELWARGSAKLFSGKTGWVIQPCAFLKCWNEWGPKRGDGFKGRHNLRPADAEEKTIKDDSGEDTVVWMRPNGNTLVETREHYVLDGRDAYVIPFTSTGHTVSRTWMALMNQHRDASGRPLDSFARRYRLTTVKKENKKGSWYLIKVDDEGWVPTSEEYDMGAALYDAVMSGEKTAEEPGEEVGGRGGGTGGDGEAERAGI